ncbi:Holliday junction branch migration protein RuvA [Candidatus Dependentiae bacterium HGW-Dependentiae-1]|nr:MAG: Holliday junction branch migration protein RuvA [Candidatus Dependentiae bacterium HGW-Dependentiae-1]
MFAYLSGTVQSLSTQLVVVDVGGVGFAVSVPRETVFILEQKIQLYTHLHWNQEQGPSLFGFATEGERTVFLLMLSCSGVGPKLALSVLADLGVSPFLEAIQSGNEGVLSSVSGIGAKKAEQIIVHLKHKIAKLMATGASFEGAKVDDRWHEVSQVLQTLNYSRVEINSAMSYVREMCTGKQEPFDQMMRHALSFLSKAR